MRNRIAAVLLFLSWPVCTIHDFWQKDPVTPVRWIIFDKTVFQDYRWYFFQMELWLSATFVITAMLVMTRRTRTIRILLLANLWISIIDLGHYWLFFRRNAWFLAGEGMIMALASILIFYYASTTSKNEKAR